MFPSLPCACVWPFIPGSCALPLWCLFTVCCFARVSTWKEFFCTSKCCAQILALKAGKVRSGNLFAQALRLTVGNWKHADKHLTVSRSLLGKHRIPVYYWLLSQSTAYYSPTALLSARPRLRLRDDAPAPTDICVNKENKHFASAAGNKWSDLTHPYGTLRPIYVPGTRGPGPDDYSKGCEVSGVRESVSESNRGGPVTILFVLKA